MKLEICGYVPELHFPKHFSLPFLEGDVFLDLVEGSLKVSGFKVEGFELGETVKDPHHGFGITIGTNVKSVERGVQLIFRFYEDGSVRHLLLSDTGEASVFQIEEASLIVRQLGGEQIAYLEMRLRTSSGTWETVFPIKTLKLKLGERYSMDFFVGDKDRTTGLQSEVRK